MKDYYSQQLDADFRDQYPGARFPNKPNIPDDFRKLRRTAADRTIAMIEEWNAVGQYVEIDGWAFPFEVRVLDWDEHYAILYTSPRFYYNFGKYILSLKLDPGAPGYYELSRTTSAHPSELWKVKRRP